MQLTPVEPGSEQRSSGELQHSSANSCKHYAVNTRPVVYFTNQSPVASTRSLKMKQQSADRGAPCSIAV